MTVVNHKTGFHIFLVWGVSINLGVLPSLATAGNAGEVYPEVTEVAVVDNMGSTSSSNIRLAKSASAKDIPASNFSILGSIHNFSADETFLATAASEVAGVTTMKPTQLSGPARHRSYFSVGGALMGFSLGIVLGGNFEEDLLYGSIGLIGGYGAGYAHGSRYDRERAITMQSQSAEERAAKNEEAKLAKSRLKKNLLIGCVSAVAMMIVLGFILSKVPILG